ncbi:M15 family metallopeptidase [Flavobacterium zhairuonense]|uniref:M15 family metallopeptidase n=1 Tax=Flavobacterium zhairuonense TaxID=2493631 RepID=UPI00104D5099|nr:M15 family metallopeptidase [Flavobacterium zhairuonense]KAF2506805.1 M15 family metallopeptidase [Flavobacterium zhairuonense]
MKRFFFLVLIFQNAFSQEIPLNVQKIIKAYPDQIIGYKDNKIIFSDKTTLIYDDFKNKTDQELLDSPDIEDQFKFVYNKADKNLIPKDDPGRIRNEAFFKKIYGNSKSEVESKMTEIIWCPKLVNQKIKVTTVNGIDKIIKKLSAELDNNPEFKKYIIDIGGTFNWRKISGTNRLSMHSFGMTIDINIKNSNYWQWDCNCKNEDATLSYRNQIPLKLVSIFEKYGFIWGGNWKHYDTMHFEFRPELLL